MSVVGPARPGVLTDKLMPAPPLATVSPSVGIALKGETAVPPKTGRMPVPLSRPLPSARLCRRAIGSRCGKLYWPGHTPSRAGGVLGMARELLT